MNRKTLFCLFALVAIASAATNIEEGSKGIEINFFTNWTTFELYLAAIGLIALGLVNLLFGLKYSKIIIFLMGFMMSACSAYGIEYASNPQAGAFTVLMVSLISGLIGGCVFYFCYHCSIFTIGFVLGFFLVFAGLAFTNLSQNYVSLTIILSIAVGIVCGIVALKVNDLVLIISTSFAGGAYLTWAICIFIENKNFIYAYQNNNVYRLITIGLAIVGILYQLKNKSISQDDLHRDSVNSPDVYVIDMNGNNGAYNPYTGRKF